MAVKNDKVFRYDDGLGGVAWFRFDKDSGGGYDFLFQTGTSGALQTAVVAQVAFQNIINYPGATVTTGDVIDASIIPVATMTFPDGTVGTPGIRWTNETNSGFYRSGAGVTSVAILGVQMASFAASEFSIFSSATSTPRGISNYQYSAGTNSAQFNCLKARGTAAAPTTIVTADVLANFLAWGYDGSNFINSGSVRFTSEGTIAATRVPSKLELLVSTDAAPSVLTQSALFSGVTGIALTALGTNSNITLTPSGSGVVTSPNTFVSSAAFRSQGAFSINAANQTIMDYSSGGRLIAQGNDGATNAAISLISQRSDATNSITVFGVTTAGAISITTFGTNPNITLTTLGNGFVSVLSSASSDKAQGWTKNGTEHTKLGNNGGKTYLYTEISSLFQIGVESTCEIGFVSSGVMRTTGGMAIGQYNGQTGATYTISASDNFVTLNHAGGTTLTMPTNLNGRILHVRTISADAVISASSNIVPLAGGAAGTAILAATAGKWATLQCDGTNWQIVAAN